MGNYISCTFIALPTLAKHSRVTRAIFPNGEIKQFREQVRAAELMMECPNFFVANSRSLHAGRRFSALGADEELELGNVYVMFPMRRVNSMVTAGDVAVMLMAANSAPRRIANSGSGYNKVRDLPESTAEEGRGSPGQNGDCWSENEARPRLDEVQGFPLAEYKHRLVACRSRKPVLETIKEEAVLSR